MGISSIGIISSFVFKGTNSPGGGFVPPKQIVATTTTGQQISRQTLTKFIQLYNVSEEGVNPFSYQLIQDAKEHADLFKIIAQHYWEKVSKDLKKQINFEKNWKPYKHPNIQYLDQQQLWQYFCEDILVNWQKYQQAPNVSLEQYNARVDLWKSQLDLPATIQRNILLKQEQNYDRLAKDPMLSSRNLNILGAVDFEDWMGEAAVQVYAQFVFEIAEKAKAIGLGVTSEYAQAYWKNLVYKYSGSESWGPQQAQIVQQFCDRQRMNEFELNGLFQDYLAFRNYVTMSENALVLDPTVANSFESYAYQGKVVNVQQLPKELILKDGHQWLCFQAYLKACGYDLEKLDLSLKPSLAELDGALIQTNYNLSYQQIDEDQWMGKISFKKAWNWFLEDENYQKACSHFSKLDKSISGQEERLLQLSLADMAYKNEVEYWIKHQIAQQDPSVILAAFNERPQLEIQLCANADGTIDTGIKNISNSVALTAFLKEIAGQGTQSFSKEYSEDNKTYYRFLLKTAPKTQLMTFSKAFENGLCESFCQKYWGKNYKTDSASLKKLFSQYPLEENANWTELTFGNYLKKCHQESFQLEGSDALDPRNLWSLVKTEKTLRYHSCKDQEVDLLEKAVGFKTDVFSEDNFYGYITIQADVQDELDARLVQNMRKQVAVFVDNYRIEKQLQQAIDAHLFNLDYLQSDDAK